MCSTQCAVQYAEWSSDLSRGWMDFNAGLTKNFCLCKLQIYNKWSQQNCFQIRKSWVQVFRSQSQFVNIYQCHTVLNVISDRRQFTLKLIREWVAPLSTAWPEETKPEIFLGKETEFWSIFRILYDAVLPPSDPSSFTFPLWFIRSAGGTVKMTNTWQLLNFIFKNLFKFHF